MSELSEQIKAIIENEPVSLFMKGTPQLVMCGNSDRALRALRAAGAPVTTVDVLPGPADPPGAVGALGLADDPAGVHQGRARRRRRHRRGAVRER